MTRGDLKNIFNTEIQRNRVTQRIHQFYALCVTQTLCISVLKFFTFETAADLFCIFKMQAVKDTMDSRGKNDAHIRDKYYTAEKSIGG